VIVRAWLMTWDSSLRGPSELGSGDRPFSRPRPVSVAGDYRVVDLHINCSLEASVGELRQRSDLEIAHHVPLVAPTHAKSVLRTSQANRITHIQTSPQHRRKQTQTTRSPFLPSPCDRSHHRHPVPSSLARLDPAPPDHPPPHVVHRLIRHSLHLEAPRARDARHPIGNRDRADIVCRDLLVSSPALARDCGCKGASQVSPERTSGKSGRGGWTDRRRGQAGSTTCCMTCS
jgi:hypothetical protein